MTSGGSDGPVVAVVLPCRVWEGTGVFEEFDPLTRGGLVEFLFFLPELFIPHASTGGHAVFHACMLLALPLASPNAVPSLAPPPLPSRPKQNGEE